MLLNYGVFVTKLILVLSKFELNIQFIPIKSDFWTLFAIFDAIWFNKLYDINPSTTV